MAALKLGPGSIPIIGDGLEANRAGDGAAAAAAKAGLSATTAIGVFDHHIVIVPQSHTSFTESANPSHRPSDVTKSEISQRKKVVRRRGMKMRMVKRRRRVRELGSYGI